IRGRWRQYVLKLPATNRSGAGKLGEQLRRRFEHLFSVRERLCSRAGAAAMATCRAKPECGPGHVQQLDTVHGLVGWGAGPAQGYKGSKDPATSSLSQWCGLRFRLIEFRLSEATPHPRSP